MPNRVSGLIFQGLFVPKRNTYGVYYHELNELSGIRFHNAYKVEELLVNELDKLNSDDVFFDIGANES